MQFNPTKGLFVATVSLFPIYPLSISKRPIELYYSAFSFLSREVCRRTRFSWNCLDRVRQFQEGESEPYGLLWNVLAHWSQQICLKQATEQSCPPPPDRLCPKPCWLLWVRIVQSSVTASY